MATPVSTPNQKAINTAPGHPPLVEQVKDRAIEFGQHAAEAVTGFSWLWPVRGLIYSITHPNVFFAVRGALLKTLGLSAAVFVAVAFFTFLPQMAILAFITGPFAPIIAFLLVLAESVLLLTLFARQLFLGPALTEVFDATLRAHGQSELVKQGRKRLGQGSDGKDLGKALVRPLQGFTFDGILRYAITLPLNFIPVVGTVFFLLYNGSRGGPGWHSRYYQLKGLNKAQKQTLVSKHAPEYTAFGAMTLLLNFIPIIGLLFSFTNTVGAAMWAAELEAGENLIDGQNGTQRQGGQSGQGQATEMRKMR